MCSPTWSEARPSRDQSINIRFTFDTRSDNQCLASQWSFDLLLSPTIGFTATLRTDLPKTDPNDGTTP